MTDFVCSTLTCQGNIKLISSKGGIKYLRAKLSDEGRLLFTQTKHNNEDIFVLLEVIPNHDYENSCFLKSTDKIKSIEIEEGVAEKSSDIVEIKDLERTHWLGKLVTFSETQEGIVKRAEECRLPLIISGAAGSGKTSVALESLKRIQEKFKGGKILYITKSENLIKESKKLFECEHYNQTTGEPETSTLEEIDFLSVHEFLKKIIKKDIEGKKPINRNKFFLWFNGICKKDRFKKYKKDGDKIFEEFIAVIAGGGLGRKQYGELGDRQAIFLKEKRANIYSLFEEYKKFIEKSSGYYDTSLIAHECIQKVQANYDAVVVDEVQDLTESVLDLILKSLKDENKSNFLLCGDVNQVIHPSFFSKSRLKSFLGQNGYVKNNESEIFYTLDKNYRNSELVIELANRILHLKNYCFASEDKMKGEEKKLFFMESKTRNTGNVGFIAKDEEQEIAEKVPQSINWAVLVLDDESKESARKLFKTPLVFNIHEAKGLEFENVILYEFTSHKAYNEIWDIACPGKGKVENTINEIHDSYNEKDINTSRNKDKGDISFKGYKFYMNALYVGVTRAINSVYIIGNERECNLLQVIRPGRVSNIDIKKEESTPEEWEAIVLELIDNGNIEQAKNIALNLIEKENMEQAKNIAEKLLRKGEKEYFQEVMCALKAKIYNRENQKIESQSSLDKNQSEHAMESFSESEIDTENLSYQSHQNRNEDEENKPKELMKNKDLKNIILKDNIREFRKTDISPYDKRGMLLLALESASFRIADYFINSKDINLKNFSSFQIGNYFVGNIDPAILCEAIFKGYKNVVEFLLQNGAGVNNDYKGGTPLHFAARVGRKDIAELLLRNKANVNSRVEHWIPLHVAARYDHKDVVELFLSYGADINAKVTEVDIKIDIMNLDGVGNYTPLHFAARYGCNGVAELLLQHEKVDVNAKANEITLKGYTPLHTATAYSRYDVVRLLLQHEKVDVNAEDHQGYIPLHLAVIKGCKDVVKLLLRNKANVNAKNKKKETPLALALESELYNSEIIKLLLASSDINIGSVKKRTYNKIFKKKLEQDSKLFKNLKEATEEKDKGKLCKLLKEIKDSLKPEGGYGFKPSLNYSPDGSDENTTIKIAIKAGGKLLQLLYAYAKENIGVDTEIFKQLERAKEQQENSQPKSGLNGITIPNKLAQVQVLTT